jgi:SAM-dependent methyltransferase
VTDPRTSATRRSYDRVAASYLERFEHELDDKPFDRSFLDDVAALSSRRGWLIDLGSGPTQIGSYLAARGLRIMSVDLSLEMLRRSGVVLPGAPRIQADLRALPFAHGSIEGIVAFYSVIHVPPPQLADTIDALRVVLMAGGHLAITTHVAPPGDTSNRSDASGDTPVHVEEMLSETVDMDFYFYGADRLSRSLEHAGFRLVRCTERDPYRPEVEAQTRRAYILAEKLA